MEGWANKSQRSRGDVHQRQIQFVSDLGGLAWGNAGSSSGSSGRRAFKCIQANGPVFVSFILASFQYAGDPSHDVTQNDIGDDCKKHRYDNRLARIDLQNDNLIDEVQHHRDNENLADARPPAPTRP